MGNGESVLDDDARPDAFGLNSGMATRGYHQHAWLVRVEI
jgi:hypothetical protein